MKQKYLLIICTGLAFCLAGCNKEGNKVALTGKWQEIKLRMYVLDSAGHASNDTTYLQPTLNSSDFIEFDNNNTCIVSSSHLYYPAGQGFSKNGLYSGAATFNYLQAGSKFILSSNTMLINPGGFITTDTIINPGGNSLQLHSVFYGHQLALPAIVSDGYYVK